MGELSETEREILTEVGKRMDEIATRKPPPKAFVWANRDFEELREHGPRYSPADWFGGGQGIPEKYRVRYLRAVHAMRERGLVQTAGSGRRMSNVKLTDEGMALWREIAPAPPPVEADKPIAKGKKRPTSSVR